MEIQYTCGWRQVTQLLPDGKHPHVRHTLGPGESIDTELVVTPDIASALVIDASGPITATANEITLNIAKPLVWLAGSGILFPFGTGASPVTLSIVNPSESESVDVRVVAIMQGG